MSQVISYNNYYELIIVKIKQYENMKISSFIYVHFNQPSNLKYIIFHLKNLMHFQFYDSVNSQIYNQHSQEQSLLHPATHKKITIKTPQTQEFLIQHVEPITCTQQNQFHDRVALNKLRRIDLKYKEQQEKQNWIQKHKNKMKNIQQHLQNRKKIANRVREDNILNNVWRKIGREKQNQQKSLQLVNRYQISQEKIQECRNRAKLKKNQYIVRIQNKTSQKFQQVNQRKKIAQQEEEEESKKIHLEQWNNYKSGLIKKYSGKQLRSPNHLYEQYKTKNIQLKTMLYQICNTQKQGKSNEKCKKRQNSEMNPIIPKFHPNKLTYFGINSQYELQSTKKDLQKIRIFLQQQSYNSNEEKSLINKFKNFMICQIL